MEKTIRGPRKDLTNQRFGKLVATSFIHRNNKYYWVCACDCGETATVNTMQLTSGKTKSCGCLRKREPQNKAANRLFALQKHLYQSTIARRNKKLGFINCITFEEFVSIVMEKCHYCHAPYSTTIEDWKGRKIGNPKISEAVLRCNGIDRIDNNKGYVTGNVVSCCKFCNTAKMDLTIEEFHAWIKRIYQHQQKEKTNAF